MAALPAAGKYLTAPGLLAHIFLRADGQDAQASLEQLRALWHNVTGRLGLADPIPRLGVSAHLPRNQVVPAAAPRLLAAAERDEASVWQASAWADHDILGLTAMMAPPRSKDCSGGWADLEHAWQEATAGLAPSGVLAETRIFLALLASTSDDDQAGDDTADGGAFDLVRAAAPEPSTAGWWQHWDTVSLSPRGGRADLPDRDEVLVWEIGPESHDARITRRLAAVAPAESERQVDQFLWTSGTGTPAPLTRHLIHAARLRYQIGIFDDGKPSRQLRDEIDVLADGLSRQDQLPARLRQAQGAAIRLKAKLGAMRHAVGIIGDNMRAATSLPDSGVVVGPLSEDRDLVTSFGRRLDHEIIRLDAAAGSAESASVFLTGAARPGTNSREPWVVVLTALGVEYEAIRAYLGGQVREHQERNTLYELGTLPGVRGSWRAALVQTGPGSTTAGLQLERAVPVFSPEVVLFLGVAGGRKDVARGDVVAAEVIYDYEWGKSTLEGYEPRMRTHEPAHRLVQRAHLVVRENRWQLRIRPRCPEPPPASFVKPIVTGSKVIADNQSQTALLLDRYASDALAVETEGYGFLAAAHANQVDALVIRGISDLLSGKDEASDEYWQPVASRHAAAFAVELLDSIGANRA